MRSGYTEGCEHLNLYRGSVDRAIQGKRGQAFLHELRSAMEAMPDKILIKDELINVKGECCTIGVICQARGISVVDITAEDPGEVGKAVGIARAMAGEITFMNDDDFAYNGAQETPGSRWVRMYQWVNDHIVTT